MSVDDTGRTAGEVEQRERVQVFGRYLLVQPLGRGGMGEVYLARSGEIAGFEKACVIKKILPRLAADASFVRRFIDEAKVTVHLAHPNIATVYEVGRVGDEYFIALEYVRGRDLSLVLSRAFELGRRLPPDVCLLIARDAASGLAHAHRRVDDLGRELGLVHCDVSPSNILVSFEGNVKLIDFGIARCAQRGEKGLVFGKQGYTAPEQMVPGQAIDRRADVYAVGVVLYEMLTGGRLFGFAAGTSWDRVARTVLAGPPEPPSERAPRLGRAFDELVMRALRTDPAVRYQWAEELRDAIQETLSALYPTASADTVARCLSTLFPDETEAGRALPGAAGEPSFDLYLPRLAEGRQQTISFAVSAGSSPSWVPTAATGRPSSPRQMGPRTLPGPAGPQLLPRPAARKHGPLFLAAGVVAGALLTVLAVALLLPGLRRTRPAQPGNTRSSPGQASATIGDELGEAAPPAVTSGDAGLPAAGTSLPRPASIPGGLPPQPSAGEDMAAAAKARPGMAFIGRADRFEMGYSEEEAEDLLRRCEVSCDCGCNAFERGARAEEASAGKDGRGCIASCPPPVKEWFLSAVPRHVVDLPDFHIDWREVSNREYQACVAAGACQAIKVADCLGWTGQAWTKGAVYEPWFEPDLPVICVRWQDASHYCAWRGKRLPSEAEWEKAARGVNGQRYPWGPSEPWCEVAKFAACSPPRTSPVGSHPKGASPYGVEDLAGNVAEWTSDWSDASVYRPGGVTPGSQPGQPRNRRVVRGGGWLASAVNLVAALRGYASPDTRRSDLGFRCAR